MNEVTVSEKIFVECSCGEKGHILVLEVYGDEEESRVSFSMQLPVVDGFFRRILTSLRYIFRPSSMCHHGAWSCCSVTEEEHVRDLIEALDKFVEHKCGEKNNSPAVKGFLLKG